MTLRKRGCAPDRASDDELLRWLDLRSAGHKSAAIAATAGVTQQAVSSATVAVRRADQMESGEDVTGAYW